MIKTFLSEFIYGGMDGIITTSSIVSGVLGADISYNYAFILGISSLFSDGFSMGISRYNSLSNVHNNDSKHNPIVSGFATFLSFIIVGFLPLIPFLILDKNNNDKEYIKQTILLFTLFSFFLVGFIKGIYVKKVFYSIFETIIIGSIASLMSYYIAKYFK